MCCEAIKQTNKQTNKQAERGSRHQSGPSLVCLHKRGRMKQRDKLAPRRYTSGAPRLGWQPRLGLGRRCQWRTRCHTRPRGAWSTLQVTHLRPPPHHPGLPCGSCQENMLKMELKRVHTAQRSMTTRHVRKYTSLQPRTRALQCTHWVWLLSASM